MKKGKYIDYNIMLACLSHRKEHKYQQAKIDHQLTDSSLESERLFKKYTIGYVNAKLEFHQKKMGTINQFKLDLLHI